MNTSICMYCKNPSKWKMDIPSALAYGIWKSMQKNHNIYLLVNIMQNYPEPYQYQHPFPYYYHYIFYVLFLFILIILVICAYIKIRFRFWAMQPVFHIYDLHYYIFPCGIINYELPEEVKNTIQLLEKILTLRLES